MEETFVKWVLVILAIILLIAIARKVLNPPDDEYLELTAESRNKLEECQRTYQATLITNLCSTILTWLNIMPSENAIKVTYPNEVTTYVTIFHDNLDMQATFNWNKDSFYLVLNAFTEDGRLCQLENTFKIKDYTLSYVELFEMIAKLPNIAENAEDEEIEDEIEESDK